MKPFIHKTSFISFVLFAVVGMISCNSNTTNPVAPISTDNYPTLNFATDFNSNTVSEGDTIMFQVTPDRPFEDAVTIELSVSGTNLEERDYQYEPVTIPAFSEETIDVSIIFPNDNIPENESKEITFALEDQTIGTKYTINPNTEFPERTVTLENYNDPSGLTVSLDWENSADDLDLFGFLYQGGEYTGTDEIAATADIPETIIEATGLEGVWYYTIDPYDVQQPEVNYTLSVGYPNQDVEIFKGSFNAEQPDLIADLAGYRVLQVMTAENANGNIEFTVENLNPDAAK